MNNWCLAMEHLDYQAKLDYSYSSAIQYSSKSADEIGGVVA